MCQTIDVTVEPKKFWELNTPYDELSVAVRTYVALLPRHLHPTKARAPMPAPPLSASRATIAASAPPEHKLRCLHLT
jgi:hypothetical protein